MQDKINNVLLLDKDNPAYINLFNKNLDIVKPIVKKQLDAENAQRISQGKKKIPIKIIIKIKRYEQSRSFKTNR